jgi:hypothetical protein
VDVCKCDDDENDDNDGKVSVVVFVVGENLPFRR